MCGQTYMSLPLCDVSIHLHFEAIFLNPGTHPLDGYRECIPPLTPKLRYLFSRKG